VAATQGDPIPVALLMNRTESDSPQDFSARQGQYLAFIHAYTFVNGRPPAQSDNPT
jgi:hypothetical protein